MNPFTASLLLATLGVSIEAPAAVEAKCLVESRSALTQVDAKPKRATVTGRIVFDGTRPEPKALPASPEQAKGCCPDGKAVNAVDPKLVVDAKNGIQNVLVTIEVPGAKVEAPSTPYVVDQKACVFEPHCTIVPAGAKVVFKNSDQVSHNVHVYSARNDSANDTIPGGAQKEYVFAKADKITVGCDYHPWMSSLVLVVDTPFATLTKSDGTFAVPDLQPGTYKVKIWHEVLGRGEGQVVIKDDGTSAPLELKLAPAKQKN